MLSTIARFLRSAESVTFTLSRDKSGLVRVLIQPVLGEEPKGLDDDAQQLRANLAKPLITTATEAELDDVLPSLLGRVATARDSLSTMYEAVIAEMNEQAEKARRNAEAKAASKAADKGKTASMPTPPPVASAKAVTPTKAEPQPTPSVTPAAPAAAPVQLF